MVEVSSAIIRMTTKFSGRWLYTDSCSICKVSNSLLISVFVGGRQRVLFAALLMYERLPPLADPLAVSQGHSLTGRGFSFYSSPLTFAFCSTRAIIVATFLLLL